MKNIHLFKRLLLAIMMCISSGLSAQVTIGSTRDPSTFSLLDVDTYPDNPGKVENKKGMHLPILTEQQRNELMNSSFPPAEQQEAEGLMIYNESPGKQCVEYWNGTKWVALGNVNE